MNLIFRMLYVLMLSLFRERLDINFHMNNGRYLTICDLNRIDLFARSGLLMAMYRRNWIPVIAEHTMAYKKPLGLFERFDVMLEVTHWDEKYFYMKHVFSNSERILAEGTSKGCVYARGHGVVSPAEALAAVEQDRSK
jgi:acyl-CoA thioesterase FadM